MKKQIFLVLNIFIYIQLFSQCTFSIDDIPHYANLVTKLDSNCACNYNCKANENKHYEVSWACPPTELITSEDLIFVRFYSGVDSMCYGRWIAKPGDLMINHRLPFAKTIEDMLAIPNLPEHYLVFTVPAGTKIMVGIAAANKFGPGGYRQFCIETDFATYRIWMDGTDVLKADINH